MLEWGNAEIIFVGLAKAAQGGIPYFESNFAHRFIGLFNEVFGAYHAVFLHKLKNGLSNYFFKRFFKIAGVCANLRSDIGNSDIGIEMSYDVLFGQLNFLNFERAIKETTGIAIQTENEVVFKYLINKIQYRAFKEEFACEACEVAMHEVEQLRLGIATNALFFNK